MTPLLLALAIERGIETLFRLDPESQARLRALDGRVLRFEITSPTIELVAIVANGRVSVPTVHDGDVDLTVTGSLEAIRSLGRSTEAVHRGDVTIRGDLGVANALRSVVGGIDLDLVEIVTPLFGDTLAHKLGRVAREAASWFSRTGDAMRENSRDYFEEEAELVATHLETDRYAGEVDALRSGVDRLEARIARLEIAARRTRSGP